MQPDHTYKERRGNQDGLLARMDILRVRPLWASYISALGITAAAIGMRQWLDVLGNELVPFALFYPAVLACTLIGGRGPGLLSLTACTMAATIFWLEPRGFLEASGVGLINLLFFVVTSGSIILVAHYLRSGYHRLRQSEQRLSLAQEVGRIGIWDLDLKSGALWWSPTFYEVSGISRTQAPNIEAVMERIDAADRDRAYAAFETARQGLNRLDIEFRFQKDDGTVIWLAGRAELFRDEEGRPSRLLGINFDATHMRTIEGERDQANALLRTFFDSLPGAAYVKDAEGRILLANSGYAAAVGQELQSFLGKTDVEFLRNKEQARTFMTHDQATLREGISQRIEEDVVDPDGVLTHWLSIKTPFFDAQNTAQGIVGISLNMTERRNAEKRLRFLSDEVDHRAKNLLGVVQSIVRLTKADDIAAFKATLTGRIQALARAHSLLAASRWKGADLATLVKEELAPFDRAGEPRVVIAGPAMKLEPNAAQALAMVLHELAINAARHGALSVDEGELRVTWQTTDRRNHRCLELEWAERKGPAIAARIEPGFGSSAIRGAIEHQLHGEVKLDWSPAGLKCHIHFPVEQDLAPDQPDDDQHNAYKHLKTADDHDVDLAGKRVLVLDDEPLIAITLAEIVAELGCEVTGPARNASAAISLIRKQAPDLAILDVNLGGGASSAPVAHALRALGIPFVYCTGYAEPADQIEAALQAQMLTKPVDPEELANALRRAVA